MIFGIGEESVFLGYSLDELGRVCGALEEEGIHYRVKCVHRGGSGLSARGRSSLGLANMKEEYLRQYEVLVKKADDTRAQAVAKAARRRG